MTKKKSSAQQKRCFEQSSGTDSYLKPSKVNLQNPKVYFMVWTHFAMTLLWNWIISRSFRGKKVQPKNSETKKHIWHPQLPYLEQVLQHSPANLQPYPRTCSRVRPQTPRDKMLRGSSKDVCQAIALDKVSAKRTTRRRVASMLGVRWDHLWEQGVVHFTYISNHLKSTGIKVGQTKTYKKLIFIKGYHTRASNHPKCSHHWKMYTYIYHKFESFM